MVTTKNKTGRPTEEIARLCAGRETIRLMEVCGTHTVSLFRSGIRSLLPPSLRLVSGPGCPVCVTSQGYIDAALDAAGIEGVAICTYGDMVRVPGRRGSLEQSRARGANIVVCYSILDSLRYAEKHPDQQVIFLSVGFETTAPSAAAAVIEAKRRKIDNFFLLCGHKLVMPALNTLLAGNDLPIDGFLLPGHVSVIIGSDAYGDLVEKHGKCCVIAGFEPGQIMSGIEALARQAAEGSPRLENVYGVAVTPEGNCRARECMEQVFEEADAVWRAMGTIPKSGLDLNEDYRDFDAIGRFGLRIGRDYDPPGCRCGEVIQGKVEPSECALFGKECTNHNPVGPCMVSSEGTCAAWYRYGGER